jgi:hypothetical protein
MSEDSKDSQGACFINQRVHFKWPVNCAATHWQWPACEQALLQKTRQAWHISEVQHDCGNRRTPVQKGVQHPTKQPGSCNIRGA